MELCQRLENDVLLLLKWNELHFLLHAESDFEWIARVITDIDLIVATSYLLIDASIWKKCIRKRAQGSATGNRWEMWVWKRQ